MKTSELIARLQKIHTETPFDADVVSGDDWMPADLIAVTHEAPNTFLEFRDVAEDTGEQHSSLPSQETVAIPEENADPVGFCCASILDAHLNGWISSDQATQLLSELVRTSRTATDAELLELFNSEARGG